VDRDLRDHISTVAEPRESDPLVHTREPPQVIEGDPERLVVVRSLDAFWVAVNDASVAGVLEGEIVVAAQDGRGATPEEDLLARGVVAAYCDIGRSRGRLGIRPPEIARQGAAFERNLDALDRRVKKTAGLMEAGHAPLPELVKV